MQQQQQIKENNSTVTMINGLKESIKVSLDTLSMQDYNTNSKVMTHIAASMNTLNSIVNPGTSTPKLELSMMNSKKTNSEVFGLFPIPKDDEADWGFYCRQEVQMWTAKELKYSVDQAEYPTLSKRHQELYKDLLGFFAVGDGLISTSLLRLLAETERYSSQIYLIFQMAVEAVHSESYNLSITSIIPDEAERSQIFKQVDDLPCVKNKAKYIKSLIDSDAPYEERMIACACTEGIFFVGLFAIIFYLRSLGKMKTFSHLNKLVMIDETLHRDRFTTSCRATMDKGGKMTQKKALQIVEEAVNLEIDHLTYILREPIESKKQDEIGGVSIENISLYIKSLADQILVMSGFSSHYNVGQIDLPWMSDISAVMRANFYETEVVGYKRLNADVAADWKTMVGKGKDGKEFVKQQSTSEISADPDLIEF
jgi:ribonucleoside-diphosphate reductase subunit M2